MIDLSSDHLALVRSILAEHVPDCEVRAFGSRVNGTARKYSDLDLALVSETPVDPDRIERLKDTFSQSDLPIIVDVVDINTVSDDFRKLIEREWVGV